MTLSNDEMHVYIGFKYYGVVKRFRLDSLGIKPHLTTIANSGDVTGIRELWPGLVLISGSDCTVRLIDIVVEAIGNINNFMRESNQRRKSEQLSCQQLLYSEVSSDVLSMTDPTRDNDLPYTFVLSQVKKRSPKIVGVFQTFTVDTLDPVPDKRIGM